MSACWHRILGSCLSEIACIHVDRSTNEFNCTFIDCLARFELYLFSPFFYESFLHFRYLADSYRTMADNDELLDYEDEEQQIEPAISNGTVEKKDVRGNYVSIHSSGFRDFLLKPEILRAIIDCGFEHPSEGESLNTPVEFCFCQSKSCVNIPNSAYS